jgi:hypothetical protein
MPRLRTHGYDGTSVENPHDDTELLAFGLAGTQNLYDETSGVAYVHRPRNLPVLGQLLSVEDQS